MPRGKTNKEFDIKERVKHATSMSVSLDSNDSDTFPRCVVYALRLIDERKGTNERDGQVYQTLLRSWRKAYSQEIKQRATNLTLKLGIQSPPTQSDWEKVGEFLKNVSRLQVIVESFLWLFNIDIPVPHTVQCASEHERIVHCARQV